MEVAWDELADSPTKFERLCDALAHRWYPDGRVRVFNGAGGDGGRDAWVEDERTALEFKSFTTLGSAQRRQIERSLARAAELEPLR